VRRLILLAVSALLLSDSAMAQGCGYKSKSSNCGGFGGKADSYGGCSVETSDAYYNVQIRGGRARVSKICSKNPPSGYCGCADYGIF